MIKQMGIRWNLRRLMAEADMYQTSDLVPRLAELGIDLSRQQVHRLVTGTPQRLSTDVLAALCHILECTPNDLIEVEVAGIAQKKAVGEVAPPPQASRTTIRRPEGI